MDGNRWREDWRILTQRSPSWLVLLSTSTFDAMELGGDRTSAERLYCRGSLSANGHNQWRSQNFRLQLLFDQCMVSWRLQFGVVVAHSTSVWTQQAVGSCHEIQLAFQGTFSPPWIHFG